LLSPFAQRLTVSWARSIAYYENRWRILHRLENDGLMYQFRIENDIVFTRLGDADHLLSLSADGFQVNLLRRDSQIERVRAGAEIVWEEIAPTLILDIGCAFQWVEALKEADFDAAKAKITASLIAEDLPGVVGPDPAFLLVGQLTDPPSRFALECGVVEPSEIPPRLAREVGQMTHIAHPDVPSTLWSPDDFAPVSFFCDSDWSIGGSMSRLGVALDDVWGVWERTREAAGGVVLTMANRATGGIDA
jgi:hypothetical protein